jgi:hypothetical protein
MEKTKVKEQKKQSEFFPSKDAVLKVLEEDYKKWIFDRQWALDKQFHKLPKWWPNVCEEVNKLIPKFRDSLERLPREDQAGLMKGFIYKLMLSYSAVTKSNTEILGILDISKHKFIEEISLGGLDEENQEKLNYLDEVRKSK